SGYLSWLQVLVVVGAAVAGAGLIPLFLRRLWTARTRAIVAAGALGLSTAGFLAAPTAWSATALKQAVNGVFPGAGPSFVSGLSTRGGGLGFGGGFRVRRPGGRFPGGGA